MLFLSSIALPACQDGEPDPEVDAAGGPADDGKADLLARPRGVSATVAPAYLAHALDQAGLGAVADRVVSDVVSGRVSLGAASQGRALIVRNRSVAGLRSALEITFGQGNPGFGAALLRFNATTILAARAGGAIWTDRTSEAAGALAANLTQHGSALRPLTGTQLTTYVQQSLALLSAPDVLAAYGVRDVWQLVDRVGQIYLGGAGNGSQARAAVAQQGTLVLTWLSAHPGLFGPVLPGRIGQPAPRDPLDIGALVQDVESWLTVTGTSDATIDQYAEPAPPHDGGV